MGLIPGSEKISGAVVVTPVFLLKNQEQGRSLAKLQSMGLQRSQTWLHTHTYKISDSLFRTTDTWNENPKITYFWVLMYQILQICVFLFDHPNWVAVGERAWAKDEEVRAPHPASTRVLCLVPISYVGVLARFCFNKGFLMEEIWSLLIWSQPSHFVDEESTSTMVERIFYVVM